MGGSDRWSCSLPHAQRGLEARRPRRVQLGDHVGDEQDESRVLPERRGDAPVARGLALGPRGRVEVGGQEGRQVAGVRVAEEQLLGQDAARREDGDGTARPRASARRPAERLRRRRPRAASPRKPSSQIRPWSAFRAVTFRSSSMSHARSGPPPRGSRSRVAASGPRPCRARAPRGGRGRRSLVSASSKCRARYSAMRARAWGKSTPVTKSSGVVVPSMSRRTASGSRPHARGGRWLGPRHTGSNPRSTPLSVYCGVQPAASWNRRMARMRRSAHRSNQCQVPRGTRIRSPASTSMANTGPVRGWTWKTPVPFEDEAHLVLVVPMLAAELREHGVEARGVGPHVDHVGGHVAAAGLQAVDLGAVGLEHLGRGGGGRHRVRRRPPLVVDAVSRRGTKPPVPPRRLAAPPEP